MSEPTWEVVLRKAFAAVEQAEVRRDDTIRAALDAGVSTRAIAAVTGVGHSTIWRMAGANGRLTGEAMLNQPAKGLPRG